jgi:cell volume regulation protein A
MAINLAGLPPRHRRQQVLGPAGGEVGGGISDYTVKPEAPVAGRELRDLALPEDVMVMLRGTTTLDPGDHVFVPMRTALQPRVNRRFTADLDPL